MAVELSKTAQDYVVAITVPISANATPSGVLAEAHRQLLAKLSEQSSADTADDEIARLTAAKAAKIDLAKL